MDGAAGVVAALLAVVVERLRQQDGQLPDQYARQGRRGETLPSGRQHAGDFRERVDEMLAVSVSLLAVVEVEGVEVFLDAAVHRVVVVVLEVLVEIPAVPGVDELPPERAEVVLRGEVLEHQRRVPGVLQTLGLPVPAQGPHLTEVHRLLGGARLVGVLHQQGDVVLVVPGGPVAGETHFEISRNQALLVVPQQQHLGEEVGAEGVEGLLVLPLLVQLDDRGLARVEAPRNRQGAAAPLLPVPEREQPVGELLRLIGGVAPRERLPARPAVLGRRQPRHRGIEMNRHHLEVGIAAGVRR